MKRALMTSKISPDPKAATEASMPVTRQGPGNRGRNPELEAAFGARLRAARIAARMSQTKLGDALGVSFQQVQKYENGKDRVAASTLQAIAAALGVHPGSFFDDDMLAPSGSVADARAAMRLVQCMQRVRDPVVVQRLLALVEAIAAVSQSIDGGGEGH